MKALSWKNDQPAFEISSIGIVGAGLAQAV
jgi:hypothetical protein